MNRKQGLTLVELLVAASLLVLMLGLLTVYLQHQSAYARQTQARSEVQDKVRMVMQVVTQDLEMAGARRYVNSDGTVASNVSLASCYDTGNAVSCLDGTDNGTDDQLTVEYITGLRDLTSTSSLDGNSACRKVDYRISGSTLQRSDVDCRTSTGSVSSSSYADLADNVLVFNVQYICSTRQVYDSFSKSVAACTPTTGYPRRARVVLYARSNNRGSGTPSPDFTYETYDTSASAPLSANMVTHTASCPAGFVCYGLTREILLPNMKEE